MKKIKTGENIIMPTTFLRVGKLFDLTNKNHDIDVKIIAFLIPKNGELPDTIFSGKRHSKKGEVILVGTGRHWLFEIDLSLLFDDYEKLVFAIRVNGAVGKSYRIHTTIVLENIATTTINAHLNPHTILRLGEIYIYDGDYKFKVFNDVFCSENKFTEIYQLKNTQCLMLKETSGFYNPSVSDPSLLKQIFGSEPKLIKFKVAILGIQGVGKTSMIAAIHGQLPRLHSLTELKLQCWDTDSKITLFLKNMLNQYDSSESASASKANISINGPYRYRLTPMVTGSISSGFILALEFIECDTKNLQETIDSIKNGDVLILAIDTPSLMENNGRWHELINAPRAIIDCFKNAMVNIQENKLVLLAPLKCEYYVHDGDHHSVLAMIQQRYTGLFNFLNSLQKNVALAITPIQTLGNVHLIDIHEKENGPEFIFERHPNLPTYSPRYADQLLIYILSFILSDFLNAYGMKISREGFDMTSNILNKLLEYRKQGAEGYKILQGFRLLT